MLPFVIDSVDVQTVLLDFSTQNFRSELSYWVDGQRDPQDNTWYNYAYGQTPAIAELDWLTTADPKYGDCLSVTNYDSVESKSYPAFKVDGLACPDELNFACEFVE